MSSVPCSLAVQFEAAGPKCMHEVMHDFLMLIVSDFAFLASSKPENLFFAYSAAARLTVYGDRGSQLVVSALNRSAFKYHLLPTAAIPTLSQGAMAAAAAKFLHSLEAVLARLNVPRDAPRHSCKPSMN